jgi:hypothetical protein
VGKLKYFGTTLKNKKCMQEEIKSKLDSEKSATIPARVFRLPEYLLKTETEKCISIMLPVILYGCESLFLILKEEYGLKIFGNRMLRKIVGTNRK